jgi:arginyl-tRNA synthetase
MSKRSGDFVTLREVVEEVGPDPIRFMMVYRKNDAPLDFDFQKVTEQSKDNPVFYVQYAHARTCSVFRQAAAAHEPHRIAFYLHELASDLHAHWNRGKELPQLRFINPNEPDSTRARLALVEAVRLVLSSGLAILGVAAPEEMR